MTDLSIYAAKIKDAVSCKALLEANGVTVNRQGFAVCPLHGDTDASLKVYGSGRGWCCYGCHKGGDVINLARNLYGIGFNDAIRRINDEFSLGLDLDGKPSQKESIKWKAAKIKEKHKRAAEERKRANAEKAYLDSIDLHRICEDMVAEQEVKRDQEWSAEFCMALRLRESARTQMEESYWEWIAYG